VGTRALPLPVAHGPSVGGQSVRLVESENGRTVGSIPLSESPENWRFWAVELQSIDQLRDRLRIVAEDNGNQ